jgi:hypothetical protein
MILIDQRIKQIEIDEFLHLLDAIKVSAKDTTEEKSLLVEEMKKL